MLVTSMWVFLRDYPSSHGITRDCPCTTSATTSVNVLRFCRQQERRLEDERKAGERMLRKAEAAHELECRWEPS